MDFNTELFFNVGWHILVLRTPEVLGDPQGSEDHGLRNTGLARCRCPSLEAHKPSFGAKFPHVNPLQLSFVEHSAIWEGRRFISRFFTSSAQPSGCLGNDKARPPHHVTGDGPEGRHCACAPFTFVDVRACCRWRLQLAGKGGGSGCPLALGHVSRAQPRRG